MCASLSLSELINLQEFPLHDPQFRQSCKNELDARGVLTLKGLLREEAIQSVQKEGECLQNAAFYTTQKHTIYLSPQDPKLPRNHARNRLVESSKGALTDDQIAPDSALHQLYDAQDFREFLCAVLGEKALFEYADNLSSVNLHFASEDQELGWHFDNSSFAITLMIQKPDAGGVFEYVSSVRDADAGEMNYEKVEQVLDGKVEPQTLSMDAGDLVLFRGRNSLHRVTPVLGSRTRMLVVLAYNTEPNIALSESARMTFYGRLE